MRFKMSFGQGITNTGITKGLEKIDETVENLKTLQKLWKWLKKLGKLVKR